jgi:hypothetical protein
MKSTSVPSHVYIFSDIFDAAAWGVSPMLRLRFVSPFVGVFTFGCAVLPSLNELTDARPDQIIDHVRCELNDAYAALAASYKWLEKWDVSYNLTALAERSQSGGLASAVWTIPARGSLGATALGTHQGIRKGTVKYKSAFKNVAGTDCPTFAEAHHAASSFEDNLGVKDWLKQLLAAWDQAHSESVEGFGYSVSFVAKVDVSLRPGLVITNLTAGGTLGVVTANTNLLELVFAPSAAAPKPLKVCVVDASGNCPTTTVAPVGASPPSPVENEVLESLRAPGSAL